MSLEPYYNHAGITVYNGECSKVMKDFESNSVDTIITDPPYALEFMGKGWDKVLPDVEVWKEALRVAKPGSMLLAFGGTRTYHRLTCNIEDAGWEIKDCIMWLYGSGFPKSLNIAKSIQKSQGVGLEDTGVISPISRPNVTKDLYRSGKVGKNFTIKNVTTSEAQLWEGWGTALKPAWEPIVVAMKPIDGTFANNALKWGVGGLNIDGGRVEVDAKIDKSQLRTLNRSKRSTDINGQKWGMTKNTNNTPQVVDPKGRFPANLILDEEAAEMLDEQSGKLKSGTMKAGTIRKNQNGFAGNMPILTANNTIADSGGASRFFYCAKASKAERNKGCEGLKEKQIPYQDYRENVKTTKSYVSEYPDGSSRPMNINRNNHPTVNPIKLMEYLCKLTMTPTGGVVLDPFMGSGTTGVACKNLNRECILIDKEQESCEIAVKRLNAPRQEVIPFN